MKISSVLPTECDASNNDINRGDIPAMLAARDKVCEEFNKNRNVKSFHLPLTPHFMYDTIKNR